MRFVVLISIGDLEMDRQTDGHTHSLHHNIDVVNYDSQIKILKPCIKSVAKLENSNFVLRFELIG